VAIEADATSQLRWMDDPEGQGLPVTLADGQQVPRLPGLRRWLWADDADLQNAGTHPDAPEPRRFIGVISLRWMPGNAPLPLYLWPPAGAALQHLAVMDLPFSIRGAAQPDARAPLTGLQTRPLTGPQTCRIPVHAQSASPGVLLLLNARAGLRPLAAR